MFIKFKDTIAQDVDHTYVHIDHIEYIEYDRTSKRKNKYYTVRYSNNTIHGEADIGPLLDSGLFITVKGYDDDDNYIIKYSLIKAIQRIKNDNDECINVVILNNDHSDEIETKDNVMKAIEDVSFNKALEKVLEQ